MTITDQQISLMREIIERSEIIPDSDHGQRRRDWVVLEFPWGRVQGRPQSIAYRLRTKLHEHIGRYMTAPRRNDDLVRGTKIHQMMEWALRLSEIIDIVQSKKRTFVVLQHGQSAPSPVVEVTSEELNELLKPALDNGSLLDSATVDQDMLGRLIRRTRTEDFEAYVVSFV